MDVSSAIAAAVADLEPGGELVGVRALRGGVSADVFGVEIATADGRRRRVVWRRHRHAEVKQHLPTVAAKEYQLLVALHGAGFAVPEPYLYVETGAGTEPYLVMDWIDGSTELGTSELDAALDQMAEFLVELHALDPTTLQLPALEPIEDPRIAIVPYLPSTEIGREVAARLSSGARGDAGRRGVLHGDYWPGNVLWRGGTLVAVVDWEDAMVGDPLADLATARVELLCQYGDNAMSSFTASYLARFEDRIGPAQLDMLTIWELYVSASALAAMGRWGLAPADEAHRRQHTERFFKRAAEQFS
jgi:aminoglycoside phosphotransferase (APT) family kinase protein